MISALNELESVVRCIELGAEDYLPKPFNPILLRARIGACLEKKRLRDGERRLFSQLRENHDRLEELAAALHLRNSEMARWRQVQDADLAIARTTQQAVISLPPPRLNGWQVETVYTPLIQVGGDVYGWRQLDRDVWLFWLADATGHGVSAALFTTLVASLFDRAGAASTTARGILTRVNAEFHSVLHGRSFMTACCAVLTADGQLSFAGAGHPPLLIRRADGEVEALPSLNMLMGIDPVAEMREATTSLASGDVALLFTDGLHSLKSQDGQRLTTKSVASALTVIGGSGDFLSRLVSELVRRSDAQPLDDDLTAIALRRM
jgi:sigma-B regulation protein RsbU (phosphoserine phosphatase)